VNLPHVKERKICSNLCGRSDREKEELNNFKGHTPIKRKEEYKSPYSWWFLRWEWEKWAHQYGSENELDIDWLGWVDYRELAPVIADSDCGLFVNQPGPRYLKGLPTKIFEYMIMGLPVVSATGPLLDSLINGKNLGVTVDSDKSRIVVRWNRTLMEHSNYRKWGKGHTTQSRRIIVGKQKKTNY
jgi:glycosyltransferase involved in cell wall biosynthesis